MTRRTFVQTAVLPAAALAQTGLPPEAKITSSVVLANLSDTFAERLDKAARSGVQAIELGEAYRRWTPREVSANRKLIRSYGLAVNTIAGARFGSAGFIPGLQAALEVARELDAPNLLVTSGPGPSGVSPEARWNAAIEAGNRAGDLARQTEKYIVFQAPARRGEVLSTATEALKLVQGIDHPHCKLAFDVHQHHVQGGTVLPLAAEAAPHVRVYHVAPVQPGAAQIDYPGVYRAIAGTGFSGVICMDFKPERTGEVQALAQALDAMRAALRNG